MQQSCQRKLLIPGRTWRRKFREGGESEVVLRSQLLRSNSPDCEVPTLLLRILLPPVTEIRSERDNFLQFRYERWQLSVESRGMLSPGVFRGAISKLSLRKKLTILASVGVLLPLLVLTYMQYRSLAELQNKTKGAFKDNLRQGLTIVENQMKQRLEEIAAQTLNPIGSMHLSSLSSPGAAEEFEKYFADVKRSHPEIEEIFAFGYRGDNRETDGYAYIHSDKFLKIAQAEFTPRQSDILFQFDRSRMAQSFLDGDRKYLFVHHSCPTCPPSMRQGAYLFYPLNNLTTGEQSGFAGVLLNGRFVNEDLIAGSIGKA